MSQLLVVDTPKPFSTSYSKLKNFETCARRYHEVDVLKNFGQGEKTEELDRGDRLHLAMKNRVMNNTELSVEFIYMEDWAKRLTTVMHPQQQISCELKLAITRDKKACAYFDKRVWFRCLVDYMIMVPDRDGYYVSIVDYKTGKPKDDDTQLIINALIIFANYPKVHTIRSSFLWTEYNDTRHFLLYPRDIASSWRDIVSRTGALEAAHLADNFPPKKCGLCREYCPVTTCENWGK